MLPYTTQRRRVVKRLPRRWRLIRVFTAGLAQFASSVTAQPHHIRATALVLLLLPSSLPQTNHHQLTDRHDHPAQSIIYRPPLLLLQFQVPLAVHLAVVVAILPSCCRRRFSFFIGPPTHFKALRHRAPCAWWNETSSPPRLGALINLLHPPPSVGQDIAIICPPFAKRTALDEPRPPRWSRSIQLVMRR